MRGPQGRSEHFAQPLIVAGATKTVHGLSPFPCPAWFFTRALCGWATRLSLANTRRVWRTPIKKGAKGCAAGRKHTRKSGRMPEPAAKVPDASAVASECNINARPERAERLEKCYDAWCIGEARAMPVNRPMNSEEPVDGQQMGRVLRFEPRTRPKAPRFPFFPPSLGQQPVADVDKYARGPEDAEDYRHRMRTNLAAILVVGLLIWCGYWLFDTLAEMRKMQDCVLSGRTNCAPINIPAASR
jgi:hypothetical protein